MNSVAEHDRQATTEEVDTHTKKVLDIRAASQHEWDQRGLLTGGKHAFGILRQLHTMFSFINPDLKAGTTCFRMLRTIQQEVVQNSDELHPEIVLDMLTITPHCVKINCTLPVARQALLRIAGATPDRLLLADVLTYSNMPDVLRVQCSVFESKNSDYGASYMTTGLVGILVRMVDKLKRLQKLQRNPRTRPRVHDESYADTLLDLSVYALLAIRFIDVSKEA